jgi:hypothetical protein
MLKVVSFSNQSKTDQTLLKLFVDFHWELYKDELRYVPLLDYEYLGSSLLGITGFFEKENYFFEHAEARFFLVMDGDQVKGRCIAFTNHAHNTHWNDNVGFFGQFECVDDDKVGSLLLQSAEDWLRSKGKTEMRGPQNLPMNESTPGFLVEEPNPRPVVYYHYNPTYYAEMVSRLGFKPVMNVMSYEVPFSAHSIEDALTNISKRIVEKNGVTFEVWKDRPLAVRKEEMFTVYNEAWSDNFGFVPFSKNEFYKMVDDMQMVMDKDLFIFAYVQGELAAFFGAVPNILEALALERNKRGFELFRAAKMFLTKSKIKGIRTGYLGIRKAYRKMGLDAVLILKTTLASIKNGYEYSDMGWVLESNTVMIKTIERVGAKLSKRYTIFEKPIAASQVLPLPEIQSESRQRPFSGSSPGNSEVA